MVWHAVDPVLTHCLDVLSIDLDLKAERTSETGRDDDFDLLKSGPPWLWQRIVMRIVAGRLSQNDTFVTSITFANVAMFHFEQIEFERHGLIESVMSAHGGGLYSTRGLTSEAGFNVPDQQGDQLSTFGAFCLWVCDESPIVRQLAGGWKPWLLNVEAKRAVLKHFMISCDELGTFHVLATGATTEREGEATRAAHR